ncbi:acyl CoA dehydrogenase [Bradyrhizobium diazoefficiens USDA 110]|uniref:Acyl CoA dehydrogenase n=1 Tax=Bradyrhizobium diazoefficiens (strain JCM 10833 / BCRC 13528 / IAM 13628 / NBRC 14792 / USDA 110) TaxID=224911 RepID=Q89K21_BRADU|nr:acyl-CoA dehydrogenase family protein [Bradyrhizobium diazoefficiens]AND90311.1 acyl-CoA dehydrogenase [Bradyrhizobium diazoefficiens USDA 110]PDT59667.1 DNA alkylation response protein [Bradyrhizobium diazoefficiens]QBP23882.1 DNA alkylation response protein [Bradyrhizobium diazoefficiens]QLD43122.1 acyl-CoA dehydrogenase family protein [Bradyrhizobium diazoefficiens]BAC50362.1 acyl CoA dehydrogenase [Bradyrhizobium diazoefficiens USDA 110]
MTQPSFATHEVFNQSPLFWDVDLFAVDRPLVEAVKANGGAKAERELSEFGKHWGSAAMADRGRVANENTPKLRTFDAKGNRRDQVEFHPAYHELMAHSAHAGVHNSTWTADGKPAGDAAEVIRAAKFYIASQVETGHLCPITMTRASVAALATQPDLLARVMPVLATKSYDPTFAPWWGKRGMTLGIGMTEKQGGTDVRANMTRAVRDGDAYRITGHKWFMSAPMCDAFLVLAQADEGLTCFFMPRFAPDGSVNAIQFQRLKDKLGNRSNASSEVEFAGAYAQAVGEAGKGIRTIIQMVQLTRQDCAIASTGLMRSGLAHALHHARHRSVFQKHLADQPLMQAVLSDMALHVEASVALVMRLCRAFDRTPHDAAEAAYMRLLTPAIKYWTCKSAPSFLYEAMECLGGNGYVEDGILARHYRESPVNAIWEGSGNVMCLDVLRALSREPEAAMAVLQSLAAETKGLPGAGEAVAFIGKTFRRADGERVARLAVEKLALLAAAAALNGVSPRHAELFAATRLATTHASMYGAVELESGDVRALLERALP